MSDELEGAPEPPRVTVRVAPDKLLAWVTVRRGAPALSAELLDVLTQAQVLAGVDQRVLELLTAGLAESEFAINDELVARSTPPEEGEDGEFRPAFKDGIQPGHVREDGTVDFHDRELLKPVQKGACVGQILAARPGNAGYRVDATPLAPRPVREVDLSLGPGVECDSQGVVRAVRAGVIVYLAGQSLDVVDQHVHPGPVDLRSGHLQMEGCLVVNGDVCRAFAASATGDLEIRGGVENGSARAGGNLRIRRGVRGGDGSMVCAGGDLSVQYAERATLYAGRLLQVADSVHSQLAAPRVEVTARLRGGLTRAELSVVVKELGSAQGFETELSLGEPLEPPLEQAQRNMERAKAMRVVGLSHRDFGDRTERRAKGGKLGRARADLERAERQALIERVRRRETLSRVAFVQANLIHPGVVVRVGHEKLEVEQPLRSSRISLDPETKKLRTDKIGP